jgi:hypothetical protein
MKIDETINKDVIDKMLATLKQDMDWNKDDPYEAVCLAGGLTRYHFAFASSSQATSLTAENKETVHVQSDFVRVTTGAIENGDVKVDMVVKFEHEEEKFITDKLKDVNKNERDISSLVNSLKKTKSLLLSCKKKEGPEKVAECQKMLASLDKLQDELLNHAAMGECIDKGDKDQLKNWLKGADELCDLAINAASLAKRSKGKFANYLSS